MRVLVVSSGNSGHISPFVKDQINSLEEIGLEIDHYSIKGQGFFGYLSNLASLRKKIKNGDYQILHAHYGLSGLLANLQMKVPVVTTFHGSDIDIQKNLIFSFIASRLSSKNIFVHPLQPKKLKFKGVKNIIPCGINLEIFKPIDKNIARKQLNFHENKNYILFSGNFENKIKNADLAFNAIKATGKKIELIELKGYSKKEVSLLMSAVDLLLVTSSSETGPLVVKEAMACNCPIVSTDVGDVKLVLGRTKMCFVANQNPKTIAEKISSIIDMNKRSNGRKNMNDYELKKIAVKVKNVYKKIISSK